jgi:hypothetical protein
MHYDYKYRQCYAVAVENFDWSTCSKHYHGKYPFTNDMEKVNDLYQMTRANVLLL